MLKQLVPKFGPDLSARFRDVAEKQVPAKLKPIAGHKTRWPNFEVWDFGRVYIKFCCQNAKMISRYGNKILLNQNRIGKAIWDDCGKFNTYFDNWLCCIDDNLVYLPQFWIYQPESPACRQFCALSEVSENIPLKVWFYISSWNFDVFPSIQIILKHETRVYFYHLLCVLQWSIILCQEIHVTRYFAQTLHYIIIVKSGKLWRYSDVISIRHFGTGFFLCCCLSAPCSLSK